MAIFLWYGHEKSLLERVQAVLDAGFTSASLWWEEKMGLSPSRKSQLSQRNGA